MSNKEALRELQNRLAERLQAVRSQSRGVSWLAAECGGRGFLLPLQEAGEIFSPTTIVPVAHAKPWFLGVRLVERVAEVGRDRAQLVAFNAALEINCALLVDRLAGLRSAEQLAAEPDTALSRPSFVGGRFRDATGRLWQELRLSELAHHEAFLRIVD